MESVKFNIESIKNEKGDTILRAVSMTEDFLPMPWLEYAAKDSINQRLIWRHSDPEKPRKNMTDEVFGRVLSSEVKNVDGKNKLFTDYKLFNVTDEHKKLIELIHNRFEAEDPIGISMGFLRYKGSKSDDIKHIAVLEHSITPKPECKICKTIDIVEDVQMENEKQIKLQTRIAELEDELDNKNKHLEELEAKIVSFEEVIKEKDSLEENLEKEKQENESNRDMIIGLKDQLAKLEQDLDYQKIKPLVEEIIELEKDEDLRPFYEKMAFEEGAEDKLKARLEKVKAKIQKSPIVTSISQSRKKTLEENEEKEKMSFEESVSNLETTAPGLGQILLKMKKKGVL